MYTSCVSSSNVSELFTVTKSTDKRETESYYYSDITISVKRCLFHSFAALFPHFSSYKPSHSLIQQIHITEDHFETDNQSIYP